MDSNSFETEQFENSPSDQPVALAPQRVENDEDSMDSFFGRQPNESRPRPERNANGKVVLRANPVERNVVYVPPTRLASKVAVPALEAGFKKQNTAGNWLRGVAQQRPASVRTASVEPQEKLAAEVVAPSPEPAASAVPQAPIADEPKKLAVKLRAIPMTDEMVRGQRVDVRFREHQPTQREMEAVIVDSGNAPRQPAMDQPIVEPVVAPIVTLSPNLNLIDSNPAADQPALDRTAKSTDAVEKLVTPPWRIK